MAGSAQRSSIAILDDYHNIASSHFSRVPNLDITVFPDTLHPQFSEDDHEALVRRLQPFSVVSTMRERTPLPESVLQKLPNLKLLLTTALRNLSIPEKACADLGITYAGTTPPQAASGFARDAQARFSNTNEHTWALLLALAKNVPQDDFNVKTSSNGGWETSLVTGLAGKTIGLVGLGKLGAQAAVTASLGFGMRVVAWSENLTQGKADAAAAKAGLAPGSWRAVSKKELFEQSDMVSVHLILSDRSRGIIGMNELQAMKSSALFVNTSRGPLVDEKALLQVLEEGKIRGAALDVFEIEPLPRDSPFRSTKWGTEGRSQLVLSPHMGYSEIETMNEWYRQQAANVERWLKGEEVQNKILPAGSPQVRQSKA
jgi:phosphoglycerate dehydrogenase-like enzyme